MIRRITSALAAITLLFTLCMPVPAFAFDPFNVICGVAHRDAAYQSTLCQGRSQADPNQNPLTGGNGLLRGIANIIAITAGLAAVIIVIVSGFRLISSGGDAAKAKSAREAIIGAIIGLVIIALADSIISFVIGRL